MSTLVMAKLYAQRNSGLKQDLVSALLRPVVAAMDQGVLTELMLSQSRVLTWVYQDETT